jgi:hypothetical protein
MMRTSSSTVDRLGGPATILGGVIWLLAWAHFLLTHGPTASDNRETFLGLSYYDSTKLIVFAMALCIVGLMSLRTRRPRGVRTLVATWGHFLAVAALVVMSVGVAISVWSVPWGETTRVATTLMDYGFIAMMIATLIAFPGLTLLGIGVVRAKVLPAWTVAPLAVAGLAAVPWIHHTLHGGLIGLSWVAVGYALWRYGAAPVSDAAA